MKVEEVLKLVDAGFTKEEIIQIASGGGADPKPEEKKPEVKEDPKPEEKKPEEDFTNALNDILSSFRSLAEDIKKSNIANSRMPDEEQTSAEQILASIIAPPAKERGKN